jgi:hypothetical protein
MTNLLINLRHHIRKIPVQKIDSALVPTVVIVGGILIYVFVGLAAYYTAVPSVP